MESNRYSHLLVACHTIKQLYDAAFYGQRHGEVKHLKILEKLGSKPGASLGRKDLRDAVTEVSAIQGATSSATHSLELTSRQVELLKKALREHLRAIRAIPLLARCQAVIALSATFEGFVADVIRQVFDAIH